MWSRTLLFAEPAVDAAPPMWHRPSAPGGQLISLDPVLPATPMWHRAPTGMPMCPCCTSPTAKGLARAERAEAAMSTPPRSPVSMFSGVRPSTTATTTTCRSSESAFSVSTSGSASGGGRRLQHQASSFSLKIKRGFARLRGRSSVESL